MIEKRMVERGIKGMVEERNEAFNNLKIKEKTRKVKDKQEKKEGNGIFKGWLRK